MEQVLDVFRSHRKALLAVLTVILVQFVDSETADWIVGVLGSLLVVGVPNDQAAVERIYPRRR